MTSIANTDQARDSGTMSLVKIEQVGTSGMASLAVTEKFGITGKTGAHKYMSPLHEELF